VHALEISNAVLWVLQIATIVVLIGVARQVGVLHLRLPARGTGRVDDGPPIGSATPVSTAQSLRGTDVPLFAPGVLTLLTFVSPGCGACAPVVQAVSKLRSTDRDVRFVIAVDGDREEALPYLAKYGVSDAVSAPELGALGSRARPFCVVLGTDGTVIDAGIPNTLEQVEYLLAQTRSQMASSSGDGQFDALVLPEHRHELPILEPTFAGDRSLDDA
jgi:methylamine dehydrogenase accessory protein MauD